MAATYRAVMLMKPGGPEALQIVELPVEPPGPGQLRVRVRAAGVGSYQDDFGRFVAKRTSGFAQTNLGSRKQAKSAPRYAVYSPIVFFTLFTVSCAMGLTRSAPLASTFATKPGSDMIS